MSFGVTVREIKVEAKMTTMFPKKESAKTAATTGNMLRHPLTMFEILAAVIFLMLNSSIKKTIKFITHPKEVMDIPNNVTAPHTSKYVAVLPSKKHKQQQQQINKHTNPS